MYKLFTDKPEVFECDIKVEGTSLNKSKARLVIETKDYSRSSADIPVKKLKGLIDENSKGNIRLEVIAEDTYFTPWESNFEVQASKKVTVEVKSQEEKPIIAENTVKVSNIKNEITESEKKHIVNILKLLIRENINLENLHLEKDKVNNIIATYIKEQPIEENLAPKIIDGIIEGLTK